MVVGQIGNPQSDNVLVKIFKKTNNKLSGEFSGILHISDVSDRYVDSMNDVCKPGDIIRAKVISTKNRIDHLSTNDKNLGVLYAFCSRCGGSLEPCDMMNYDCPKCGNIEKRKIAPDYGKEPI